ncbi:unnamed protein product, partial [Rotaria socialis]
MQDTFLIGHARRTRKLRQRQKQLDPEAYRLKVNTQRREHRLRTKFHVLTQKQAKRKNRSLIKKRETDRKRQKR